MRARNALIAALLFAIAQTGCSTWRIAVILQTGPDTNHGRPLQVMLRSLSVETYRSESYAELSQLVLKPDKSVIRQLTLDPLEQTKRRLYVTVPADQPLGLYFFYMTQTGSWKMLLPPRLPWTVTVPLGRNGVDVETVRECRIFR
jgi:hypothetical protein